MKYRHAERIATLVTDLLYGYCDRIVVAGSLRRLRPECRDIDIVLIPRAGRLLGLQQQIWNMNGGAKPEKNGNKYMRLANYDGIPVDIYIATPATWPTLLLIRTGSKAHNIRLCQRAREQGRKLCANGDGLISLATGDHVPLKREEDIFDALDLPYREPFERE